MALMISYSQLKTLLNKSKQKLRKISAAQNLTKTKNIWYCEIVNTFVCIYKMSKNTKTIENIDKYPPTEDGWE